VTDGTLLDTGLGELGAAALVVVATSSRDPYLAPFVRGARLHHSLLIVPRGGAPRLGYFTPMERGEAAGAGLELLTPEKLDVERWVRDHPSHELFAHVLSRGLHVLGIAPGKVALAGSLPAGWLLAVREVLGQEGWTLEAGEALVERWRRHKGPGELAAIEQAAAGTCAAMRRVAEMLAASDASKGALTLEGEPLTVGRLRSAVAQCLSGYGLEQPWGNIVAPAEEGAIPHSAGTDERVVAAGESLVVDLFPRGLLAADCTRTFCVGEPSADLARGHATVLAALDAAREAARPGARGWDLQEQACRHIIAAGWPTPLDQPGTTRGYVHGLGHGVGYEIHELPSFRRDAAGAAGRLEAGDVITLEPGLYEPEDGWAVRLEDLYAVTEGGVRNLTPLPYDLDPRAW